MNLIRSILTKTNAMSLLRFKKLRFWFVKRRYNLYKNKLRIKNDGSSKIGEKTISHNLSAFESDAAFGCGERMALLIYPVVGYYSYYTVDKSKLKVLIVGCRTEDDIYWMKSYGFYQTYGFDLFSYSKHILVGDIHQTDFANESFDVVLLGWMISYTKDPATVVKECRRILKPGGLLGIGLDHIPNLDTSNIQGAIRVNPLNSSKDLVALLDSTIDHKVVFEYNHYNDKQNDFSTAIVTMCK